MTKVLHMLKPIIYQRLKRREALNHDSAHGISLGKSSLHILYVKMYNLTSDSLTTECQKARSARLLH